MATSSRIDNFQGTDSEHIAYLETKVKQLQLTRYSPPSSPPSDVRDDSPEECAINPVFKFIPYEPESNTPKFINEPDTSSRSLKRRRTSKPRWQSEMDDMLRGIPSAEDWSLKRKSIGLSSDTKLFLAFNAITGGAILPTKPAAIESDSLVRFESVDAALRLVSRYASSVAAMNTEKLFTIQIVNFCNLIFVSQCCVLIHCGVEKSRVDDLMKICISQSDPKNLDVLRRGAIWANRMICALADDGLGPLASEAFVLCGGTVAQYGRFADAGENGFLHFRESVSTSGSECFKLT